MNRVVLWDFDGTLAWREGLWSGCVLEVLDEREPHHSGTLPAIRAALSGRFPWHRHQLAHPELAEADAWWEAITPLMVEGIAACGVEERRARELAPAVRERFVDGTRVWRLFDDTPDALSRTAAAGWRNVILSNHVPELPTLVATLGLDGLVEEVFTSAVTGFEKPHREAFELALSHCGDPEERWMVGDNPQADVAGAEALGIPAILIRSVAAAPLTAPDAASAATLIVTARRSASRSDQTAEPQS
jgi:putative hydrolase of the HAD superfamily